MAGSHMGAPSHHRPTALEALKALEALIVVTTIAVMATITVMVICSIEVMTMSEPRYMQHDVSLWLAVGS